MEENQRARYHPCRMVSYRVGGIVALMHERVQARSVEASLVILSCQAQNVGLHFVSVFYQTKMHLVAKYAAITVGPESSFSANT